MSTIIIRDLPQDETLDRQAMTALRGGASFTNLITPANPVRIFTPNHPVRLVDLIAGFASEAGPL